MNSGSATPRIVWSIVIEVLVFIVTVALAMIDSSQWPGYFFWITMGSVVILNGVYSFNIKYSNQFNDLLINKSDLFPVAGGIYQNSVYGMAAKMPFKYTGAVVLGSNISGTFTTIISILSASFTSSERTAAIYYFIGAMFVLLACFDTYFALPLNVSIFCVIQFNLKLLNCYLFCCFQRFYRYHEMLHEKEMEKSKRLQGANTSTHPPYWTIFKQASPQLFNIFFVFFVTLALFPAVQSDISISNAEKFPIPEKLYVSILCFLTFNLCAMLGSLATSWVQFVSLPPFIRLLSLFDTMR